MHVELSEAVALRLRERAKTLGIAPEELVRAVIADLVAQPDDEFDVIADAILNENAELYRRLA
jgi:hypothetical protein